MNLKELTIKYKGPGFDLSCSEAIMYAANERYSLNLDDKHFHMVAPFSGGMLNEDVCGIITAGLCVIGILFTQDVAHKTDNLKEISNLFMNNVKDELKSTNCFTLKELHRDEITGCTGIIIRGAEILEKVISKYEK